MWARVFTLVGAAVASLAEYTSFIKLACCSFFSVVSLLGVSVFVPKTIVCVCQRQRV